MELLKKLTTFLFVGLIGFFFTYLAYLGILAPFRSNFEYYDRIRGLGIMGFTLQVLILGFAMGMITGALAFFLTEEEKKETGSQAASF